MRKGEKEERRERGIKGKKDRRREGRRETFSHGSKSVKI